MDIYDQNFDIGIVFVIAFVDFSVFDHLEDGIGYIGGLVFPIGLNCRDKGCVVFSKVAKQAPM